MTLRRLLPEQSSTTPEEATGDLRLGDLAPPDRPHLALNMIASADGAASLGGRARGLGDPIDRAVFHGLRTQVDCVMVGARTARVERYGRLIRDGAGRERRARAGLVPDPLACVVSGRLDLPADLPLLEDGDSSVVILTSSANDLPEVPAEVELLRGEAAGPAGSLTLAPFLRRLRGERGVRSILCEGGPALNRSLLLEDLVDEVFLTLAPKLVGGTPERTIVTGTPPGEPLALELAGCYEAAGALYLRYRVAGPH